MGTDSPNYLIIRQLIIVVVIINIYMIMVIVILFHSLISCNVVIFFILRGGIPGSMRIFPEIQTQIRSVSIISILEFSI